MLHWNYSTINPLLFKLHPRVWRRYDCQLKPVVVKKTFELLIIGDHPKTSFSWRQVIEQVRKILPELPILLISNSGYYEMRSIENQLQHLKVLDESFRLKDFYAIVDRFAT